MLLALRMGWAMHPSHPFALICALGEKRGLAQRLTEGAEDHEGPPANLVFDGMLTSLLFSATACALLLAFPVIIFPSGTNSDFDMWMIAAIPALAAKTTIQKTASPMAAKILGRASLRPVAESSMKM